jgi:hypothetical protein
MFPFSVDASAFIAKNAAGTVKKKYKKNYEFYNMWFQNFSNSN